VEERYARVDLDGEVAVWCGEVPAPSDADELLEEAKLTVPASDVFDDGIGIDDIEFVLDEGEQSAISGNDPYRRVPLRQRGNVSHRDDSDPVRIRIPFLEDIVGVGIFGDIRAGIEDRGVLVRREQIEKLAVLPLAAVP
jgi:hypothetical protein